MSKSRKTKTYRYSMLTAAVILALALLYVAGGREFIFGKSTEQPQAYDLRVTMIDVGQGDSIFLSSGGQYMLIDAGENDKGDDVVACLKGLGVEKLTYVVGTHPHSDHIGGLDTVINAFPVDTVYMPAKKENTEQYEDVLDAVEGRGLTVTVPKPGDKLALGKANLTFIWPPRSFDSKDENDCSIVVLAEADGCRVLLCGDIEKEAEKGILNLGESIDCDVLKVAHHGSDTSSTKAFLEQATPGIALISVGTDNSYKHPDKDIVKRLEKNGAEIHRTDKNGTITVTIAQGRISVQDAR